MGYQIQYGTSGRMRRIFMHSIWMRRVGMICFGLMVIWLLTWSSGGSWASLQNALERAAETVTEGGNVQSAVSGFCTEILHGA